MPTSIARDRAAGFSLLEVMIVVVIIGVLIAIFTLSVGSFADDKSTEHARRMEALIELAAEEAIMQGRELGLHFYQHSYEFATRVRDVDKDGLQIWAWTPIEEDRLLQSRDLGEDYYLELEIEGKEVDLDYTRSAADPEDVYTPQIYIFSSGDLAPAFSVRIRTAFADQAILINVDVEGNTEVTYDDF